MGDALSDFGDAKLVARILHWDFAQTVRDPGELFQLNFFHPARYVLAFSENLYGVSFFGFPLLAAGASAVFNYNVLLLLGMFLSALVGLGARPVRHGRSARLGGRRRRVRVSAVAHGADPAPAVPVGGVSLPDASLSSPVSRIGPPPRPGALRRRLRLERAGKRALRVLLGFSRGGRARMGLAARRSGAGSAHRRDRAGDGRGVASVSAVRGGLPRGVQALRVPTRPLRDPGVLRPVDGLSSRLARRTGCGGP